MATLMDYQDKGVMESDRFYSTYRHLRPEEYRSKIIEMYGSAGGRDRRMEEIVNAAVIAYVLRK